MDRSDYRAAWAWVHFMLHGPVEARDELVRFLADIRLGTPLGGSDNGSTSDSAILPVCSAPIFRAGLGQSLRGPAGPEVLAPLRGTTR